MPISSIFFSLRVVSSLIDFVFSLLLDACDEEDDTERFASGSLLLKRVHHSKERVKSQSVFFYWKKCSKHAKIQLEGCTDFVQIKHHEI